MPGQSRRLKSLGTQQFPSSVRTPERLQRCHHLIWPLPTPQHDGGLGHTRPKLLGCPQHAQRLLPVGTPVTHHALQARHLWQAGQGERGSRRRGQGWVCCAGCSASVAATSSSQHGCTNTTQRRCLPICFSHGCQHSGRTQHSPKPPHTCSCFTSTPAAPAAPHAPPLPHLSQSPCPTMPYSPSLTVSTLCAYTSSPLRATSSTQSRLP